ncbi:hypothetical protein Glove_22g89 [Diversispora epigaea]|uniref:Uncharacterized protein n=1 Tax=Diversispora epigaea TaxID=1348612 RepID=A0A397JJQ3_9GLOM|nr:hypothetical protein Glove_22g89 [Diversispora epigaea]
MKTQLDYTLELMIILEYGCHYCEKYYKCEIYKRLNIFTSEERERGEDVLLKENEVIEEIEINRSQEVHESF